MLLRPFRQALLSVLFLAALLALGVSTSAEELAPTPSTPSNADSLERSNLAEAPASPAIRHEIAAYSDLARKAADQSKWPLAEYFLEKLVNLPASPEEKKDALLDLAKTYEANDFVAKAIAIYEKMSQLYMTDPDQPERLLHLGKLYRESGANELAISRFYNVLNVSLAFSQAPLTASMTPVRRAQMEIAETYFQSADFAKAQRFYDLLSRLEMPVKDQARVRFQIAYCGFMLGDLVKSGAAAQSFLRDFPDDIAAPECRYLLARIFRSLNQSKEAYEQILALLKTEKAHQDRAPEKWIYWQKKAGNEFANDLYQHGEFLKALSIYQTLATLDRTPQWQWPVVYQMGLCFEKLRLDRRAAEAYKYLLDQGAKPETKVAELPANVQDILEMARWRGEQLVWQQTTGLQVEHVLGPNPTLLESSSLRSALVPFR